MTRDIRVLLLSASMAPSGLFGAQGCNSTVAMVPPISFPTRDIRIRPQEPLAIEMNKVIRILGNALPPGCRTFTSDLRVRVAATGLSTYPDAAVVCGRSLRAPDDPMAVTNPVLLVEVTSRSTEDYDRGEKLRHYQALPSVREVLIVSHRHPELTLHRREANGWTETVARGSEAVDLASAGLRLAVNDVYRDALEDAG